jgi:deazaflavin-dependent oxidoreductase (nitroreductase family)
MVFLARIGNFFVKGILRSPLHGILSENVLLITVTGRKSGKQYTTPVARVPHGDGYMVFSDHNRTWWRNLRGGAPVRLYVKGQEIGGMANVFEEPEAVVAGLTTYLQKSPHLAKYFDVDLDPNGQPNAEDIARTAATEVLIRIQVDQSA